MVKLNVENALNGVLLLGLLVIPFIAIQMDEPFYVTLTTRVAILALAGVGLNLALGLGGLVSFGHAAFFGIGGYALGILASHALNYEPLMTSPFELNGTTQMLILWPVAILASGLVALVIGYFSLRTSGVYFIMITLAFAQMLYYFSISWPAYGGEDGLSIYVRSEFPGLNTLDPIQFFLICFGALIVGLSLVAILKNSRFGAALQAARQNEDRLAAVGIKAFNIRLTAFVISAMITGFAGALFADLNRFVSPNMLSWHTSGEIMIFVILGGVGRLFGPVAGAALFIIFEFIFGGLTEHWMFFLGLVLLAVVLFARGGLIGFIAGKQSHD
ncbi:branched-chain amino acid ABC transporter permease [Sneathiella limimaris]|uniref:branched-chain amino acid ABC transporter permease n=1 Tax=Sneathiella limimaris TaxID=1964213 RepID=UPI00146A26E1|nr:branched-chain amino acid ABC transporter permease [Sneathiella limimaris]